MDEGFEDDDETVERKIQSHLCSIRIALDRDQFQTADRRWVEAKLREIVEDVDGPVEKILSGRGEQA